MATIMKRRLRQHLDRLEERLSCKRLSKPFVLRTTRETAVKIAEAFDAKWAHQEKAKQVVGPFLIIA